MNYELLSVGFFFCLFDTTLLLLLKLQRWISNNIAYCIALTIAAMRSNGG